MAGFTSYCQLRVVKDDGPRPLFSLASSLHYASDIVGEVVIPSGTETDGASVPQVFMSLVGYPGLRAAVVHDWLVRVLPIEERQKADLVFREALIHGCGVDEQTAKTMYDAVSLYTGSLGGGFARVDDPDERVGA